MATGSKRARPCEGFYRTVEDGIRIERERVPRKSTVKVDTKKMNEIVVIDRDKAQNKVKVDYVGYPNEDDERRSCDELMGNSNLGRVVARFTPRSCSLEDRASLTFDRLSRKIKLALFSSERESPEVRIEETIDVDVYQTYFENVGLIRKSKGRTVHCINAVSDPTLRRLLGEKWYERILNKNGDFSYVIRGTIQFWLHEKAAIKEFVTVGSHFLENQIENDLQLIFTFVRGDGVKSEYSKNTWK